MEHKAPPDADRAASDWTDQDGRPRSSCSELTAATTIVAELLCERINLRPGQIVLDVATGMGNGALAAARRGCQVHGIDRVPALLERARERARAERLKARFQVGDAEAIPFPDASFDVVLSVFGATFAANGRQAATELLRVCRPKGTIALASWTPESFVGTMFRRTGRQTGTVRGSSAPTTWGTEHGVRTLFSPHIRTLEASPRTFVFRCTSPEHLLELMQIYSCSAPSSLRPSNRTEEEAVLRALTSVVQRFNRAGDGSLIVPRDYLEVVATRL